MSSMERTYTLKSPSHSCTVIATAQNYKRIEKAIWDNLGITDAIDNLLKTFDTDNDFWEALVAIGKSKYMDFTFE